MDCVLSRPAGRTTPLKSRFSSTCDDDDDDFGICLFSNSGLFVYCRRRCVHCAGIESRWEEIDKH